MSFQAKLRRVALVMLVLAILNAPFVLWVVYATHLGVSEPDSTHRFSVSVRGGKRFYDPFVGAYVVFSGVLGCAAGALLILRRVFPETSD